MLKGIATFLAVLSLSSLIWAAEPEVTAPVPVAAPTSVTDSAAAAKKDEGPSIDADLDSRVINSRSFTKEKRLSSSLIGGAVVSDAYEFPYNYGIDISWFKNEKVGYGFTFWSTSSSYGDVLNYYVGRYGTMADHNRHQGYVGLNFIWNVATAKFSLFGRRSTASDLFLAPGIGATLLKSASYPVPPTYVTPTVSQTAITVAVDLMEQFYLNDWLSFNLSIRNHLYQETVYAADTGSSLRNKITFYNAVMLGLTYSCKNMTEKFQIKKCF